MVACWLVENIGSKKHYNTLQVPYLVIINKISLMYPMLGYFGSKYSSLYECLIYACEDLDCLTGYLDDLDEWVAL